MYLIRAVRLKFRFHSSSTAVELQVYEPFASLRITFNTNPVPRIVVWTSFKLSKDETGRYWLNLLSYKAHKLSHKFKQFYKVHNFDEEYHPNYSYSKCSKGK